MPLSEERLGELSVQLLSVELEVSADLAQLQRSVAKAEAVAFEGLEGLDALRRYAAEQLNALENTLELRLEQVEKVFESERSEQQGTKSTAKQAGRASLRICIEYNKVHQYVGMSSLPSSAEVYVYKFKTYMCDTACVGAAPTSRTAGLEDGSPPQGLLVRWFHDASAAGARAQEAPHKTRPLQVSAPAAAGLSTEFHPVSALIASRKGFQSRPRL